MSGTQVSRRPLFFVGGGFVLGEGEQGEI